MKIILLFNNAEKFKRIDFHTYRDIDFPALHTLLSNIMLELEHTSHTYKQSVGKPCQSYMCEYRITGTLVAYMNMNDVALHFGFSALYRESQQCKIFIITHTHRQRKCISIEKAHALFVCDDGAFACVVMVVVGGSG